MTEKDLYRSFCRAAPGLPVFVQDWYLDAVCNGGTWDVALVREGDKIIASFPFFIRRKLGFRYITMPHFVKTMGPYLLPECRGWKKEQAILAELIGKLPNVDGFIQDFHYLISDWLPFHWAGYRQTTRYTYLLDLNNLEAVYEGINRNMRRNIRKAQKTLTVTSDRTIEEFYSINKMSFDRQGIAIPYSFDLFRRQDEALAAHQARQLFFAVDGTGRIHSAAYLIWDDTSSYYHLSGDDPSLRRSGAGILLIREAIRFSKEKLGLHSFDFEGSMIRNVEMIRRQFGARQQAYHRIWKYHSSLYQILDSLARWRKSG